MKRLSLMPPAEVFYRAQITARQWLGWPRRRFDGHQPPLQKFLRVEGQSVHRRVTGRRGVRFFALTSRTPIPEAISQDEALAVADDLLAHRFTFFDLEREPFGDVIQWNYNYKDHKICPLLYAPRIDYRDERLVGDVKYVWELNRHQHLVPLAKAYVLTGDERYAREVVHQILGWIQQCPYMMGINWTTPEQAALRIISWIWAFEWIKSAACVTETFVEQFLHSLYQHVAFITQHYSRFSSANNHLICEATGVFVATVYFPELKNADRWRATSQRILIEEALRQNHDDGVNREQAMAYHCLVLEYLLLAGLLGEHNGFRFPTAYWRRVEKMMEVIAAFMDCRGQLPHFGDDDNGAVIVLGKPPQSRARSILATGAVLFGRDDFRALAPEFDERTFWLLGTSTIGDGSTSTSAHCSSSRAFPSGYYVMRSGTTADDEIVAIFDCAPLGYAPLAAHGHADALSFVLTVAGREILIDPGTYAYHSRQRWRTYFRSTSAHNTIRIDEQDQSVMVGNFMWSHKAEAIPEVWESSPHYDRVSGYHTGYLRLSDPVRHRREILFDKDRRCFHVVDTIEAEGEHLIEQFFHFAESCRLRREDREWIVENDGVEVRFRLDDRLDVTLVHGREDPPLGWRSKRLGHKQPSPTLLGRLKGVGSYRLRTTIWIEKLPLA